MSDGVASDQSFWDRFAKYDPLWAILSDPAKAGRGWDLREFLETGQREISLLMYQLRALGLAVPRADALDFGCGVGRLTQPLAAYFDRVVGVDISTEMIRLAGDLNQHPSRVRYVCNVREDLSVFDTGAFSFGYSNVVLQHVPPPRAEGYLKELLRVIAPGGLLVVQLPSHPRPADLPTAVRARMPDDAYRASVRIESSVPTPVPAGSELELTVSVTNRSSYAWRQADVGSIRLGNHWLDTTGRRMLIQDDGRASLPASIDSGQICLVTLTVTVPPEAGVYQLECDVVHEGISWFSDKGASTCRATVTAVGVPAGAPGPPVASVPVVATPLALPELSSLESPGPLPMFGVHSDVVGSIVREHGGEIVHVEADERCGPEWIGFRYFVRKR